VLAIDLHYDPPETFFLKEAAMRGCRTVNGLEMFIRQAALQFHYWTGIEPDMDVVREIPLLPL
jgi:shikimate dehydrogenase